MCWLECGQGECDGNRDRFHTRGEKVSPGTWEELQVVEMRFCEIPWVTLQSNVLYHFTAAPGCVKCKQYSGGS